MSQLIYRAFWSCTLIGVLLLSACSRPEESRLHAAQLLAMGTLVEVSIWGTSDEHAAAVTAQIEQRLRRVEDDFHPTRPGGLKTVNVALAAGRAVAVNDEMADLILRAQHFEEASQGLFNPAIGKLIALWGFQDEEPAKGPPPSANEIQSISDQHPAMSRLQLKNGLLTSHSRAVQLDFGAFAKGYAIDQAVAILRRQGIHDAIVNAGGDLRVIGRHGDRSWRVGIRQPDGHGIIASLALGGDESIVTSGSYERYFDYQGRRYHHIIDPRTGYPAQGLVSVTVLAADAQTADAAATALFVAGKDDWPLIARRMAVDQVMLIDEQGKVYLTREMARRIRFEIKPEPVPVIIKP